MEGATGIRLTKVARKTIAAWKAKPRYISSCGGTRSGKTYAILQLFVLVLLEEERRRLAATVNSVVAETVPHLRRGAVRDFKAIMASAGLWMPERWSETTMTYTFGNGSFLEFFSTDNPGKVHGSARDRLFVNECQNISYDIARQLFVRTRGRIVCDYNPTASFWLNEEIEPRDNCITLHSTYLDNEFLSAEQVAEIESNRRSANWWKVYGEGKFGELEGLIYEFELVDALPDRKGAGGSMVEIQGLDFGFTNDPTARVQMLVDTRTKTLYMRERCYRTRMLNSDIVEDLRADGVARSVPIYADCAEPKSIEEIRRAGFDILPCSKDAPARSDKRRFQIQWLQGWSLRVTKDSTDFIRELRSYTWAKDGDGNLMNVPVDGCDHLCDAMRYATWTHFGEREGSGSYAFGFGRNG